MPIQFNAYGKEFLFYESPQINALINETFSDNYEILKNNLEVLPGDVILDLGACEGTFSVLMAKTFPQARVISLEPVRGTFFKMLRNIGLNGCLNIEPYNIGIGKDTGKAIVIVNKNGLTGGSTKETGFTYTPETHLKEDIEILSLNDLFKVFHIDRVKLLKIDVEGTEYEALYNSDILQRVEYFVGEFHMNHVLEIKGYRMDALESWVSNRTKILHLDGIRMAE